jgi:hypothetical protein
VEKELVNQFREKDVEPSFAVGTSKAIYEGKLTWPIVMIIPSTLAPSLSLKPRWKTPP